MVSIDDRLSETTDGTSNWWQHPRALGPSLVLPLALAGGLAVAALAAWMSSGWLAGGDGAAHAAVSSDEVGLASGAAHSAPPGACARMQEIVETACGYKQHDHDPDSIQRCVTHELKYTMWSAYGCQ